MKRCRLLAGAVFVLLLALSVTAEGRNNADSAATVTEKSAGVVYSRFLHWGGDLAVSLTNAGVIGNAHGGGAATNLPPDFPLYYTPSFQFPFASDEDYLYKGGLWIGGIVGDDTLVSLAYEGWSGRGREFTSFASLVEELDSVRGHQVITGQYTDTAVTPWLEATHTPLGIEVTQVSHTWKSAPYDRFVIVEYMIRNVSDHPIYDAYIGLFVDSDSYDIQSGGDTYHDDVSGFLPAAGIGYSMDNDGDPEGDTLWSALSARGAIGVVPIMADPPATCTTFNWWTSDGTARQDWGPRRLSDTWDFGHGGSGTPLSDQDKYHVMSNGEKDYDQLWTAVDRSDEGWKPPPDPPYDRGIANGLDTRFVLAFGSYDLAPGDSVRLVLALVAGDSVHQSPGDYAADYDPADPQAYDDRLYFGNMIATAEWARQVYQSGFDLRGAAPLAIECSPLADDVVRCEWTPVPFDALAGFRLYRRFAETSDWTLVVDLPTTMQYWDDMEVEIGETYEYAVSSVDTDGAEGPRSHVADITVGRPIVVPEMSVVAGASWLTIDWRIPPVSPDYAVAECVNLYRRVGTDPEVVLVGQFPARLVQTSLVMAAGDGAPVDECTTPPKMTRRGLVNISPPYHDQQVTPGVEYHYSAAFLNGYGLEGDRSAEVSGAVMTFDREGLFICHTEGQHPWNIQDRDTTYTFYSAWAARWGFDTLRVDFDGPWYEGLPPERIARYRFLLIAMEDYGKNGIRPPLLERLRVHLAYNGSVVFVSRYKGVWFQTESFNREVVGIERFGRDIVHPAPCQWCDGDTHSRFRAASSRSSRYPDIDVDSARAFDNEGMRWFEGLGITLLGGGLLPGIGAIDSVAPDVEVLYSYVAGEPDTEPLHGKPVAIKRETEKGRLIYFGFPLSVMDRNLSYDVLTTAFVDLGFDTSAASAGAPTAPTLLGIIGWLYSPGGAEPELRWDVNRDGKIDIVDVIRIVDRDIKR